MFGIFGVDPEAAEVAERGVEGIAAAAAASEARPGLAAIIRLNHVGAGDEHALWIVGVNAKLVEGIAGLAANVLAFGADSVPGAAGVVCAIDFAADIRGGCGERGIALLRGARTQD